MSKASEWAARNREAAEALHAIEQERPESSSMTCFIADLGYLRIECGVWGDPVISIDQRQVVTKHPITSEDSVEAFKRQCRWFLDTFGEPSA